jgi:hypothetical protein
VLHLIFFFFFFFFFQLQTLTAERINALQAKYGVTAEEEEKDDDVKSVAQSLLSENKALGNIHSRQSVAALTTARKV